MAEPQDRWTEDGAGGARPGRPEMLVAPPPVLERGLCDTVGAAKLLDAFRPVIVVTPDVATSATVATVLARGLGAVANVEVLTFGELVDALSAARHRAQGRDELEPARERALACLVTGGAKGWFEPLAGTTGLAAQFRRFLAELRGARMSAGALTRAGLPIEIRRKLASIATCAEEFETRRDRRHLYEDRVEDATVVAERTMKRVPVLWYGVPCRDDVEARFLERMCHAATVTAFLPAVRPPATAGFDATLHALGRAGAEPMTEPPPPWAAPEASALSHLQRNLYRMPDIEAPEDGSVAVAAVPDPAAEADEAAAACLRWAAAGIRFADMAVVHPCSGPHAPLVTSALERAGVPWVRHDPPPLSGTAAARAALALASLAGGPATASRLLDFLATAHVPEATRAEFAPFTPDRWGRLAGRVGLTSDVGAPDPSVWDRRLALLVADYAAQSRASSADDVAAATSLRRLIAALAEELAPPSECSWASVTNWFCALVRRWVDGSGAVAAALAPLAGMDELGPLDAPGTLLAHVRPTLEDAPASTAPPLESARRGVSVVRADRIGLAAYEAVCLLGASDGYLPRRPGAAVLLTDTERRRLNEVLSSDLPLRAARHAGDPLHFANAVGAARSRLGVLRPRAALDGSPLAPSPYFRAVLVALQADVPAPSGAEADPGLGTGAREDVAWAPDEAAVAVALAADPTRSVCPDPAATRGRDAWMCRRGGTALTEFDGLVAVDTLEMLPPALNPLGGALSPTRLETYAACPFRFLAENILGVRTRTRGDDLDARDRGSLVHEILELFLAQAGGEEDDLTSLLDCVAADTFDRWEERGRSPGAVAWAVTRSQIHADLHRWWELEGDFAEQGWRPRLLEAVFGTATDEGQDVGAPLVVETDVGSLTFGGRIDRVDVGPDDESFRVIDYKTGAASGTGTSDGGTSLQLPLYLRAAAQMLDMEERSGSAEYFYATRRGGFRHVPYEGDEAELVAVLSSLHASLAAGDFHPEPGRACSAAGGCSLRTICGRHIESLSRTRSVDPRHLAYTDRFAGTGHDAGEGGAV